MRVFRFILLFAFVGGLFSCETTDFENSPSQLVVEGWIDADGYPVVIVTRSLPVGVNQQLEDLSEYVERWATVKVSDGTQSVVLTRKYDACYFPPYIYTTSSMLGKVGGTYTLTVDVDDAHAEAVTTIPRPAVVDSFKVEKGSLNDTLYAVTAFVPYHAPNCYYGFFVRNYTQNECYRESYMGTFTSSRLSNNSSTPIMVYQGRGYRGEKSVYTPYFKKGDKLFVKLASMDSISYSFWHTYDKMMTLSSNPLFSKDYNLQGNVKGALGVWTGMGSSIYQIEIDAPQTAF